MTVKCYIVLRPAMPAAAKKTVLRSIRLRSDLAELLAKDAEAKGISVNALVSSVLTKYAEWDRYVDKFGFVTITRFGWQRMMEGLDDAALVRAATEMGSQNPREMTLFWFKKLNLDSFLAYLSLISRYAKTITHEVEMDERTVTILVQHEMGPRYSKFMEAFLGQAIQQVVGVTARTQVGRNSIVLKFPRPERAG